MAKRIEEGEKLPFFRYDTPYSTNNRSRLLLKKKPPLVLVFMGNFGHPITRTFAERYADTHIALTAGSLALVVRSQPGKLAGKIFENTLPYPLLCDAEGTLYDYLSIPQRSGTLTTCSLEGWNILRKARRNGYRPPKGNVQQLPLTLILDADSVVRFCHYGETLTDVPEDCAAMQMLIKTLNLATESSSKHAPGAAAAAAALFDDREKARPFPSNIPVDVPVESRVAAKTPVGQELSLDLPVAAPTGYQGDSTEFDPPPTVIGAGCTTLGSLKLPDLHNAGTKQKVDRRRPVTRRYAPAAPSEAKQPTLAPSERAEEKDFTALLRELYTT